MITECDLLQISQASNWGKIYGTYYPILSLIPGSIACEWDHLRGVITFIRVNMEVLF